MEKILRINMSNMEVNKEDLPEKYLEFGGRGLTSRIVLDEVKPNCNPLSKYNKLVMAVGLLAGTTLSSSDRLSVGAKSPLTGRIKEANSGGTAGSKLAKLNYRALIIEGKPAKDTCYIIKINKDNVEIEEREDLKMLGNYELVARLNEEHTGKGKPGVISVGQAGEMKLAAAGVSVSDITGEPNNVAARGGMGAVMGSKGVKAIIIDDTGAERVKLADEEVFKKAAKKFNKALIDNPGKQNQAKYGTASITAVVSGMGAIPTNNFSRGDFDEINEIDGDKLYELITGRGGEGKTTMSCMPGCVIRCRNIYPDQDGKEMASCIQYETIGLLGSNCGLDSLDEIGELTYLCNDYGLDTIEMGATLAMLSDIGMFKLGDFAKAKELLEEVGKCSTLGRVLGQGAETTARVLGIDRVPSVKGQAMPSYDPRGLKGNGVTYATSAMGADHTAGNAFGARKTVDPLTPENQIELSRSLQIKVASVVDNTGLCLFARPPVINDFEFLVKIINAKFGWDLKPEDIDRIGKEIVKTEREFNKRAGYNNYDDRLPYYLYDEKLPPHNTVFDVPDSEIDKVHDY